MKSVTIWERWNKKKPQGYEMSDDKGKHWVYISLKKQNRYEVLFERISRWTTDDFMTMKRALKRIASMSYEAEDAEKSDGAELHHKRMIIVKMTGIAERALKRISRG